MELSPMSEMSDAFGAEFVNLEKVAFVPELLRLMPARLAHQHQALPIRYFANVKCLRIAVSDPSDLVTLDSLHQTLGYEMEICVADAHQLRQFINKLYPPPIL